MKKNTEKDSQREARPGFLRRHRRIARLALFLLLLALLLVGRRMLADFPSSWERSISKSLSSDAMDIEVDGVSFSLFRMRLSANSLALYPTNGERRAALLVASADIRLRPRSFVPSIEWIREIRLESLEFDIDGLSSLQGDSDDEGSEIPDIPPIRVSIRRVSGIGIELHDLGGTLSASDGTVVFDDASVSMHGRGEQKQRLEGRIAIEPAVPAVEATGSGFFDFSKLSPTLRALDCPGIATELDKFEFPVRPPKLDIRFYWAPPRKMRLLGITVSAGTMRYNGVRLSGLSTEVRVSGDKSWSVIDFDPLEIRRPEGVMTGYHTLDIDDDLMRVDYVSTIDPVCLVEMIGIVEPGSLEGIEFDFPADIRCSGVMGLTDDFDSRNSLRIYASAPGATAKGLVLSDIDVSGTINGPVFDFGHITAGAVDGALEGTFRLDCSGDERMVSATLSLQNVPQAQWAGLLGREEDARAGGKLDLSVTFDGPLDELGTGVPLRGHGTFSSDIRDAHLFRIPLFAGLTDILAKYIPGVNFLVDQNEAHLRATIEDGKWNLSKLSLSGAAFSVDGSGTASADGSEINIVARVRLMNKKTWIGRMVQRLLSPLSGLFGVRATGSIESPRWALAPFSRSSAK